MLMVTALVLAYVNTAYESNSRSLNDIIYQTTDRKPEINLTI